MTRIGPATDLETVKDHFVGFVHKLQSRYAFRFAKAHRALKDERNRWIQERLVTHFLFGSLAEGLDLPPENVEKVWTLGGRASQMIEKGGENSRPTEFDATEKNLAQEIGEKTFDLMIQRAEELSLAMKFKMGPVNVEEHVIAWCFCYVRQLLHAAKWESVKRV